MDESHDYFLCDSCEGKEFKPVYTFSLRFHGVNFSEELIYDKLVSQSYQCNQCGKIFTGDQIEQGLVNIKKMRRDLSS